MPKFPLDYQQLDNTIYKKAFKYADVKDQLEVVAFDIVKFKDQDKGADLWQVQNAEDGDYIVALYQEEEAKTKTSSPWSVLVSQASGQLQVSYKNDPLLKLPYYKLGLPKNELSQVASYLPTKLANNKHLVSSLLNELNDDHKASVYQKYPELKNS